MGTLPGLKHGETSAPYFLGLLDRYAAYLKEAGKRVFRSSPAEGERMFFALSEAHRKRLVSRLEIELASLDAAQAAGEKITDSPRLLWRYLRTTGIVPCSDIFGKIADGDIVEIYGMEQIHIFQNLNFFDWVSATLEQIYLMTWYQNSGRDPEIEKKIAIAATKVLTGEVRETMDPENLWHTVTENGEERLQFDLRLKYLSPVQFNQQLAGLIAVSEARPIDPTRAKSKGKDAS